MSKMMKSHVIGGFALAALGAAGLAVQVARAERPVSEGVVPPLPITHPSRGVASPVPSVPSVLGLEDMVHDSVISRVITTAAVAEAAGAAPSSPVD